MRSTLALILSAALLADETARAADSEVRGLWVVRTALVSPQDVDRVVDQASEGGFNALFVQVRGRGDAFYDSKLVARSVLLERQAAGFDPLARLIDRARARGLQVHGWVNVLLAAHLGQPLQRGHILLEHPEWLMVPRQVAVTVAPRSLPALVGRAARMDPDVEGYYLSPSAPGVREHLEAIVRELVRGYPIDGLHLDFIRYPNPDYDYSRHALEGFRRIRGSNDLLGGPAADPAAWDQYRRDVLTTLADSLARAGRYERPGIIVSAAVVPDDGTATSTKYQAWPAWATRGILDALCPMVYTADSRIFRQQVERARAAAGQVPVWAGVGAYRLPLAGVVEKIRLAREAGASGVVVFSHESLQPADWRRLREAAFPVVAAAGRAPGLGTASATR
jgi:uncharacterized lipoprotein YddW (UPF0748 family)